MDELFGLEKKPEPEVKPIDFDFKTTKGNKAKVSYKPSGTIKVSDKKAFTTHLVKVADMLEVVSVERAKGKVKKQEPKTIDAVADQEGEK